MQNSDEKRSWVNPCHFTEEKTFEFPSPIIIGHVMYSLYHGTARDAGSIGIIDAELIIIGDDEKVFLHGEWVDVTGELTLEAAKESIYELHKVMGQEKDKRKFFDMIEKRDRLRKDARAEDDEKYQDYYEILKEIIEKEILDQGYMWEEKTEEYRLPKDMPKEALYRMRLSLETMKRDQIAEEKLALVIAAVDDERRYAAWKKRYKRAVRSNIC